jgi:hypothetical protein
MNARARDVLRALAVAGFIGFFIAAVANAQLGCGSSQEAATAPQGSASAEAPEEVMFPATKSGGFLKHPQQQQQSQK